MKIRPNHYNMTGVRKRRRLKSRTVSTSLRRRTVIEELSGISYVLGGETREGLDCWGLIREYMSGVYNFDLRTKFYAPYVESGYASVYEGSPDIMMEEFVSLLEDSLIGIHINYLTLGDIVVASTKGRRVVGIYGSNDSFLITAPGLGSFHMKLSHYRIEKGFRWPLQFQ